VAAIKIGKSKCFGGRRDEIQFLCPGDERLYRLLSFFVSLSALQQMEHLVTRIHAGTQFMLAKKIDGFSTRADGSAITRLKRRLDAAQDCGHGSARY
jgi:hypothetical protein